MAYTHRTLIVPAAERDLYAQLAELLAGPSGSGMFTTGLAASGVAPATHFISAGLIDERMAAVMSDPAELCAACQQANIEATLDQCTELLGKADVSTEDAFTAMARLGLRLLEDPEPLDEQAATNTDAPKSPAVLASRSKRGKS